MLIDQRNQLDVPTMKIFAGLPSIEHRLPCSLTIGSFDGVHRGHLELLARVVTYAKKRQLGSAVITFEPNPRQFFASLSGGMTTRIANLRDKVDAFRAAGIENVVILRFDTHLAALSAEAFIDQVLISGCACRHLVVGNDFRFGAKRLGDVAFLREHSAVSGYSMDSLPDISDEKSRISSSSIRAALEVGDLFGASRLLGRPYAITGRVQHGAKIGRTIGYPTLNLQLRQGVPAAKGIFAVRVHGLAHEALPGVASVGLRPTIETSPTWKLEVHLFDFKEQVYGKLVRVEFAKKLRDEIKYETLEKLRNAIADDALAARTCLVSPPK